jgi:hypothetical protein
MSDNPAAPERNRHHTETYRSLDDFLDQFRYDPDYPSTVKVEDYRQTDLWKEFEHGI